MSSITPKTWTEFRDSGLAWWVNRSLHLLGWTLVFVVEEDGSVSQAFPARTKLRGFSREPEVEGFENLTAHLAEIASELLAEVKED